VFELPVYVHCSFVQESTDGHIPLVRKDSSLSNEVFESFESEEFSHPETVPEESSTALTTPTEDERRLELGIQGQSKVIDKVDAATSMSARSSPRRIKVSVEDSADDGLGDSIAHGSSSLTDRSKLDSADDTDTVYSPRPVGEGGLESKFTVIKCSVDSTVAMDDPTLPSTSSSSLPTPPPVPPEVDFTRHSSADDEEEEDDDDDLDDDSSLSMQRSADALVVEGASAQDSQSFGLFRNVHVSPQSQCLK
jgi:hypothetical protein